MTTLTPVQLVPPQAMAIADSMYYTVPAVSTVKIGRAVFCNTDTASHTITMNIVASGGVSATTNELIAAFPLSAGQTYVSPELAGAVMPAGTMLRGVATSAKVTLTVSGITIM